MASQGKNKTNFKTYEASTRLLAAVIATCNPKLDYAEIQKLFGESTPAGIEWQFREIKNLGKAQQAAVDKGESPAGISVANTPSAGRGKGGAGARTPGSAAAAAARTPGTGATTGKRHRMPATPAAGLPPVDSSDDDDDGDLVAIDTPSKRPSKKPRATPAKTPSRKTATAAPPATAAPAETAAPASVAALHPFPGAYDVRDNLADGAGDNMMDGEA
ncbi:putative polarity defective- variant [Rosellinia necatrix]|uniref:Putative polarity defective-variant n=1 Tax=Rosellinia necatrix TaxID=77044 RepID=A0A1S7ULF6_ROSNE|nr:putative polarity defective- variant [Rosellinia necatrix]